ncbi:MAG: response regulator [Desulfobacteraceae bacterium]|nr:response regulator [Desulfobacteraceae bacterium]
MNKITAFWNKMTTPATASVQDGITYWQEKVLLNLLFASVVLGSVTVIPSVALAIKEKLWIIAVLDILIYSSVVFIYFKKNLSYKFRATFIPIISYILGMVLITTLGPFGAGPVWLFFFPVITGVLLGYKKAAIALIINMLTIIGLGFLIHHNLTDLLLSLNFKVWYLASQNPLQKWIVISLNVMLLNIISTLSVTTILNGLQRSLIDLSRSDRKHRQIFENILDVYFETSLDGIVLEISPSVEIISNYTQDELKGQSLSNIYTDYGQRDATIRMLLETGCLKDHEIQLKNKDGKTHYCSANAKLIKDQNGNPDRIIGILRDISEQKAMEKNKKELEDRLNRSKKMESLGLLAGGVAHDLNNILSGIVTYPELLAMDMKENNPLKKPLKIIQSSGYRASEIVQDLLTLSRRGVVTKELLNLHDLISNYLVTPEHNKILSFHPHVHVEKHLLADIPLLKGSSIHLQKTIMNLVSNAAEAQPDGGTISITTQNKYLNTLLEGYDQVDIGQYLVLSIQDKGIGINPDDLKRIFEPFFTKKVMGRSGTGLGMAVVWGTVQDHDGYIDIKSNADLGTRFDLYFPISVENIDEKSPPSSSQEYKGNGEKILIIDDIIEQQKIGILILEKLGYQPFSVGSGEEAITFLKENKVDLIILDMIMEPGVTGYETYKEILKFRPNQKAIIASGYSESIEVKQTIELGAGSYIKKPYKVEKLGLAVKAELSKKTA